MKTETLAILKVIELIELTERKLELLRKLLDSLKLARKLGVRPENLKPVQLELDFGENNG